MVRVNHAIDRPGKGLTGPKPRHGSIVYDLTGQTLVPFGCNL